MKAFYIRRLAFACGYVQLAKGYRSPAVAQEPSTAGVFAVPFGSEAPLAFAAADDEETLPTAHISLDLHQHSEIK